MTISLSGAPAWRSRFFDWTREFHDFRGEHDLIADLGGDALDQLFGGRLRGDAEAGEEYQQDDLRRESEDSAIVQRIDLRGFVTPGPRIRLRW